MADVPYDRGVLVEVLVYHARTPSSGCACGWAVLGHSWPEHVADVYEESGRAKHTVSRAPRCSACPLKPSDCPGCPAHNEVTR